MKKRFEVESLSDIREMQNQVRKQGDDTPCIGPVVLDLGSQRVLIEHEDVIHRFSFREFVERLARECGVEISVK